MLKIEQGDCVEVMRGMDAGSVDAVVCDPPYGLEFMGKDWDDLGHQMQEWHHDWATEAYRVLKPGGHILAFGGSRTSHRLACAIEDAPYGRDTKGGRVNDADVSDVVQRAVLRGAVAKNIRDCHACPLAPKSGHPDSIARQPVPFRGPTPSEVLILGEAPGRMEDLKGAPFMGPAGQLLDKALQEVGMDASTSYFVANAVCCRSDGPPLPAYVRACQTHLGAQVRLADPTWVLALGSTALSAVGCTTKITQARGRPFLMPYGPCINRWVFATFHPAAILRNEKLRTEFLADLSTFRSLTTQTGGHLLDTLAVRVGKRGTLVMNHG